jgi:hypothetical protein
MRRCLLARLFLVLLALGVLWPVVALAVSCCESQTSACSIPATGFSVCCFHAASTLPDPPPSSFQPIEGSRLVFEDDREAPYPDLPGILHVPRLSRI